LRNGGIAGFIPAIERGKLRLLSLWIAQMSRVMTVAIV